MDYTDIESLMRWDTRLLKPNNDILSRGEEWEGNEGKGKRIKEKSRIENPTMVHNLRLSSYTEYMNGLDMALKIIRNNSKGG